MGNVGESCTDVCSAKALTCDANTMTDIDNDAKVTSVGSAAGVKCETIWDDPGSYTPFYIPVHGKFKNICEHFRENKKSSCETVYNGSLKNLQRFCYCK